MKNWDDILVIENYPNLEMIIVKKNSLQSIYTLGIYQCEKLKTVEMEYCAFYYVKSVVFESISKIVILCLYLPNLQTIKTGYYSFHETTHLYLSGNSIIY